MATLNTIARDIASGLNKRYDNEFIARIKEYILQERSLYYRRAIDKDGVDAAFVQSYIVSLVEVPATLSNMALGSMDTVLRTENKIAAPVRYKTPQPFVYVGGASGNLPFVNAETWEHAFASYLPIIGISQLVRYSYLNGHIFLDRDNISAFVGEDSDNEIRISAVYENPLLAYNKEDNESGIHYEDDMEFPIPYDLLANLKRTILKYNSNPIEQDFVNPPSIDNQ